MMENNFTLRKRLKPLPPTPKKNPNTPLQVIKLTDNAHHYLLKYDSIMSD